MESSFPDLSRFLAITFPDLNAWMENAVSNKEVHMCEGM